MVEMATQEKKTETPRQTIDRKPFERRFLEMKNEAQTWIPTWKDICIYENPTRGFFDDMPNQGKSIDHKTMLDSHPRRCIRVLAAGMTSGLTSPSRPWFRLGVEDMDMMEIEGVKIWLDDVQERMQTVFSRSNIYGVLNSIYEELGSFATGSAIISEDSDTVIRGKNFTIGEYYLSIGPDGRVNGFARKYWMTVAQLVKEFGEDNVSPNVKSAYDSKNNSSLDRWVAVIHLIEENDKRIPGYVDSKNMPYRSIQWEEGSQAGLVLRIGGFEEFPVLAPRWATTTTADIYGKGTGWDGLGDSKMLQKMQRKKLLALDKIVDPPVQKDGMVSGEVNTLPGGVTTSSASVPNAGVRPVYQVQIDLNALEASIEKTKKALDATFYTDLFLMLMQIDRRQITAEEIARRYEEKLLMLGPVLECLESELLDPLIERTFAIMLRAGLIPDPPPELQGQKLKVEYISILAQAQKMAGTTAIQAVCGFVMQLMAAFPEAKDKLDIDEAIERFGEMHGIPAKIIRSDEAVRAIRQAKDKAAQMQQFGANSLLGADIAKKLSEAKLGDKNALDMIISMLTGQSMPTGQAEPAGAGKK